MTVLLTLTEAGIDTGPFDLYSNLDFYTVPFEIGVSKAALQAGYSSFLVPDFTDIVRVKSRGNCVNYTDIVLVSTTSTTTTAVPTTTTTTTLEPEVPCNSVVNSGGEGVTEYFVNLSPLGGLITFAVDAVGVPDKLELIHNGVKKATTSMTTPNEGPFDDVYGDPVVPTEPQTMSVVQFIGGNKGAIPNRQATYSFETGSSLTLPVGYQQLVWWQYTPSDYMVNSLVTVRITGPSGTGWNIQRLCPGSTTTTTTTIPGTTTTTTTVAPTFLSLSYSGLNYINSLEPDFPSARTIGSGSGTTSFNIGCYLFTGSGFYEVHRAFFGFNTSTVIGATSGGIEISIDINSLTTSTQFALVRTVTNFPSNHVWVVGDFAESVGGVLETVPVTINPGQTGIVSFPFNATGLAHINSSNDCTFVLVQYTNDYQNLAPLTVATNQEILAANTSVKLYYS